MVLSENIPCKKNMNLTSRTLPDLLAKHDVTSKWHNDVEITL